MASRLQTSTIGVYKVNSKNAPYGLKKGEFYYQDKLHKDHIEIFNKHGKAKSVLNMDGSMNLKKTEKALKEGRTIRT